MATKDRTYNGHKNWNYWNVALWIGNDEGLYRTALDCIRRHKGRGGKAAAAVDFVSIMHDCGKDKTPDGAPWSMPAVRARTRAASAGLLARHQRAAGNSLCRRRVVSMAQRRGGFHRALALDAIAGTACVIGCRRSTTRHEKLSAQREQKHNRVFA